MLQLLLKLIKTFNRKIELCKISKNNSSIEDLKLYIVVPYNILLILY